MVIASFSEQDSGSEESKGFSPKPPDCITDEHTAAESFNPLRSPSPSIDVNIPIMCEDTADNILLSLITAVQPEIDETMLPVKTDSPKEAEIKSPIKDQIVRRSSRRRMPSSRYSDDFVSPPGSPIAPPSVSSKRACSSPANTSPSDVKRWKPVRKESGTRGKLPINSPSPNKRQIKLNDKYTTIGNIQLTWPRFGIKNAVFNGEIFSVTNTCPIDTGLFILYHAYKTANQAFRAIFENGTLSCFAKLRQTFTLVETDGWTTARLYWLCTHQLLQQRNEDSLYNIENTLTEMVFRFVQPMQAYTIRSKCSCSQCPKPIRERTSVDIALT